MAFALRQTAGSGRRGGATGTGVSVTISTPLAGNLLVATTHNVTTMPAGWTNAVPDAHGVAPGFAIWYKIADGSEGTLIQGTRAVAAYMSMRLLEYSGVDTSSPIDVVRPSEGSTPGVGFDGSHTDFPAYKGGLYVSGVGASDSGGGVAGFYSDSVGYEGEAYPAPTLNTEYVESHSTNSSSSSKSYLKTWVYTDPAEYGPGYASKGSPVAGGSNNAFGASIVFKAAGATAATAMVTGSPANLTYVGANSSSGDVAGGTTATCPSPTGTQAGDLVIYAVFTSLLTATDCEASGGFSNITKDVRQGTLGSSVPWVFHGIATGSNPTMTFTWDGTRDRFGVICVAYRGSFSGFSSATLLDVNFGYGAGESGTSNFHGWAGTERAKSVALPSGTSGIAVAAMTGGYLFSTIDISGEANSGPTQGFTKRRSDGSGSVETMLFSRTFDTNGDVGTSFRIAQGGSGTGGSISAPVLLVYGVSPTLPGGDAGGNVHLHLKKMTATELPYQVHTDMLDPQGVVR